MSVAIKLVSVPTEDLDAATRASIIQLCRVAHHEDDFVHLFSFIPSGGLHVLAYREHELVGHAVATTRWLQPHGLPLLRTAYIDAVATRPIYQDQGIGSVVMRQLALVVRPIIRQFVMRAFFFSARSERSSADQVKTIRVILGIVDRFIVL